MNALDEFLELATVPFNSYLDNHKKKDGKVVGFLCNHVPEELLYASGMVPYRISPTGCTETGDADAYLSRRDPVEQLAVAVLHARSLARVFLRLSRTAPAPVAWRSANVGLDLESTLDDNFPGTES